MPATTQKALPSLLRALLAAALACAAFAGVVLDAAPSVAVTRARTAVTRSKRPRVEPAPATRKPAPGSPVASPRLMNAPIRSVSTSRKVVALTFDDGPSTASGEVCSTLRRYGVRATFFNVGARVFVYPDQAKEEAEVGEVANHSWSHEIMTDFSLRSQIDQIVWADTRIDLATGHRPRWFRPRGGRYNSWTQLATARAGSRMVLWDVEGVDTIDPTHTVASITANVLNGAHPGAIILLHETNPVTRQAVPGIIAGLKAKGYTITTVSNLVDGTY